MSLSVLFRSIKTGKMSRIIDGLELIFKHVYFLNYHSCIIKDYVYER